MRGLTSLERRALEIAADDFYEIDPNHPDTPVLEMTLDIVRERGLVHMRQENNDTVISITDQGHLALRVCLDT